MCIQTISLATKGMICQGELIINRFYKFIIPLKLRIKNDKIKINISKRENLSLFMSEKLIPLQFNIVKSKIKHNITKKLNLRFKIKKGC